MSYFSPLSAGNFIRNGLQWKTFFKDLVISWPLTRTQIKLYWIFENIEYPNFEGQILVFRFGLHLLGIVVSVHLGVLSL